MRTGLLVLGMLLAACDRDALQWCGESCNLDMVTSRELYAVGDEIPFDVTLWTSEPRTVYLYDDPLCSMRFFSWLGQFEEQSIRVCKDVNPLLSWAIPSDDRRGSPGQSGDSRSLVSHRVADTTKTRLGPGQRMTIQLTARTGTDESGRLMVWFAKDVYFAFSNRDVVAISFVPMASTFASEPGLFSADYAIAFESRMIEGKWYVSVTPEGQIGDIAKAEKRDNLISCSWLSRLFVER